MCCVCVCVCVSVYLMTGDLVLLVHSYNISIYQHLSSNIFNFHQSSIPLLSYFPGILTSRKVPIPIEKRIDRSKSQSRNFVAEGVSMLLKAATGSSVHSRTSGTSQFIQNDPKQVKATTEGFNSK